MKIANQLNKLWEMCIHAPVRTTIVITIIVATVITSAAALAWGPSRPTYTADKPADHVTFNSITDNPMYGDERNFFRVKAADAPNSSYSDITKVEPGKDYVGYVYFHNNAAKNLNDEAHDKVGVATGTKLRIAMPGGVEADGEKTGLSAFIYADNATPKQVFDDAFLESDVDVALRYIPGSAKIASKGAVNGQTLPDSLIDNGTPLGYDSLNGILPGCDEFSGYVTFKFRADAPNFTIKKKVSEHGADDWKDKISAKVGEKVDYLISYKNTGSVQQNKVLVKDKLPTGMTYEKGSSILANSHNKDGIATNDGLTVDGLNIGSYAPQGDAAVKFSAKVNKVEECGVNDLVNTATAITQNGKKSATAIVTVEGQCAPNECKPGIPKGDERCKAEECPAGHVKDEETGECVASPSTLPTTGPAEIIAGLIGLGAISAGIVYYIKSRKELEGAIAEAAGESSSTDAPKLLKARTDSKPSDDKKDF